MEATINFLLQNGKTRLLHNSVKDRFNSKLPISMDFFLMADKRNQYFGNLNFQDHEKIPKIFLNRIPYVSLPISAKSPIVKIKLKSIQP